MSCLINALCSLCLTAPAVEPAHMITFRELEQRRLPAAIAHLVISYGVIDPEAINTQMNKLFRKVQWDLEACHPIEREYFLLFQRYVTELTFPTYWTEPTHFFERLSTI